MTPYFTVITPVFNQEKLLTPCIESLLAQTFRDFEVVIVDDGSTDGSVGLIKSLIGDDPRFTIIRHERNSSVLESRITGLTAAKGRYVCTIDIDDHVDANMLELLHERLESEALDFVTIQICVDGKGVLSEPPETDDYLAALLEGKIKGGMTQYVFSHEVVQKALPYVKHGYCNLGEDFYLSCILMYFSKTHANMKFAPYHYRLGVGLSSKTTGLDYETLKKQYGYHLTVFSFLDEFFNKTAPEYLPQFKTARYNYQESLIWKALGSPLPWGDFFRYIDLFREDDFDVFYHACTKIIPLRAQWAKQKRESQEK